MKLLWQAILAVLFTATTASALEPPRALTSCYWWSAAELVLRWEPSPGADGYRIFGSRDLNGSYSLLATVNDTGYARLSPSEQRQFIHVRADSGGVESVPSNTIGYVKIHGIFSHTAFGLPFVFWDVPAGIVPTYGVESHRPSDIIGEQINPGSQIIADRIVEQGGLGSFAWRHRNYGNAWTGDLEVLSAMRPGKAYFYVNLSGWPRTIVLTGAADTTGLGIPPVTIAAPANPEAPNRVPYSWRDPREIPRDRLNLIAAGFRGGTVITSDRIYEQGGNGRSCFYLNTTIPPAWGGTLTTIIPGRAYWIVNQHAGLPGWDYTYIPW